MKSIFKALDGGHLDQSLFSRSKMSSDVDVARTEPDELPESRWKLGRRSRRLKQETPERKSDEPHRRLR